MKFTGSQNNLETIMNNVTEKNGRYYNRYGQCIFEPYEKVKERGKNIPRTQEETDAARAFMRGDISYDEFAVIRDRNLKNE